MIKQMKPTPSTLEEAIKNGIDAFVQRPKDASVTCEQVVRVHVRDFLSQRFCAAMLQSETITRILGKLWERITGEKLK
jgi:thiamine monophosphate synthase